MTLFTEWTEAVDSPPGQCYCVLQKRLSTGTEVVLDIEDAAGLCFTKT